MSTRKVAVTLIVALLPALAGIASGAEIFATGSQPMGQHYNQATWSGGGWSDALAPTSDKAYRTANFGLRTVDGSSSTFNGATLRIESGGSLLLKQGYGQRGDTVVIVSGIPGGHGGTNRLMVHRLGEAPD